MNKQLILLRHAKAAHPKQPMRDYDRPLKSFGFEQAEAIADWLEQAGVEPDVVLVSAAKRTLQTIEPWRNRHPNTVVKELESLYGATTGEILSLADAESEAGVTLVVGHNPGIEFSLHYLAEDDANQQRHHQRMRPGDLAWLQRHPDEQSWQPGKAELLCRYSALR
ncbi:MAG: histidine phosphatase family protein [Xanthomonadales bacterium]|nr:histidine phosphatase family protein [Xanthomonadales bacterium]